VIYHLHERGAEQLRHHVCLPTLSATSDGWSSVCPLYPQHQMDGRLGRKPKRGFVFPPVCLSVRPSIRPSVCLSAYSRPDELAALGEDQGEHSKQYACVQHNNDDRNSVNEAVGGRHRVTQEVLSWHQWAIQSVRPSSTIFHG
jgi:hypothetical protein